MTDDSQRFERKQGLLTKLLSSINFLVTENTSTRDTRGSARIECRAEVAYVEETGSRGKGYLVDISRTGLQLETESKLSKGRTVFQQPEERAWLESLLHQLGYTDDGSQRRRFIRADSAIEGQLTPEAEGSEPVMVKVLNLGMGGALLRADEALAQNLQFKLVLGPHEDLPELCLDGTVLRIIEKPDEGFVLHPSRFATSNEREEAILNEYILKLGGRSGE